MAAKRRHQNQTAESQNGNGRQKQTPNNNNKQKSWKRRDHRDDTATPSQSGLSSADIPYFMLVFGLAITFGVLHRNHISFMFESDKHFSHLSGLERELSFRTEMGLYYSYYKTIIEAPTLLTGLNEIMYDNVTEYPDTINVLKRFNLYPEVMLGIGYRMYDRVMSWLNIPTKQCWQVNRGEGLSPVLSCEGLGEPSYFYVECVLLLNGANIAIFFLFGTFLSGSLWGGILTVMSFFYNHGECTRVQWTPPLRESFAYPFLVLGMFIVTYILRIPRPSLRHSLLVALATICFMLPWQFAQFALMTQTVAVFGCYVLQYIGSHKMKIILLGQGVGLLLSYVLLFGNEMLLTSFFASCLITVYGIVALENLIERIKIRVLIWGVQGLLLAVGTVTSKILVSKLLRIADDAHIGDIFRSKFSDFANFHTMLYTCAAEFDFMEKETPKRILKTLLLPLVVLAAGTVTFHIVRREYKAWRARHAGMAEGQTNGINGVGDEHHEEDRAHRSKPDAEVLYHVFQLLAFTAMAVIIMRLKLFWTPQLCLLTSLLASRKFFGWFGDIWRHYGIVALILGGMSVQGFANLQHQWSIQGEYSNYPLEQMVEWINSKTTPNAVFAGPMPTMATIKLVTKRPIVNHPHYEDAGLRARTKNIYSMYSRKPSKDVASLYKELKVDYAVLEDSWCYRRTRPGCSMPEIWDIEDKENHDKSPVCTLLQQNPAPYFKRVFKNKVYTVLKVL